MARKILTLHRYVLGTVVDGEFQVLVHSDSFVKLMYNKHVLDNWQIVRASDGIVIAQSKAKPAQEQPISKLAHKIAGFGASGTKIHLVDGDDFKKRGGVRPACQSKVSSHVRNGCWNLKDLTSADEITCAKCRAKYDAMVDAQSKDSEGVASEPIAEQEQSMSKLAELQEAISYYRDMLSWSDDFAECDRLLELIAECDKHIAKLEAAPVASEPVADTASKAYSARQLQIIQHFQNVYYQFGRNADTYSILVWTSADTDFIYPQEVAELIENGCEYFSVVYPKHTNMWTVPNYQINKAIASYIAPGASGHVISGHGRTSRNRKRSNQGQNQGRKPSKLYPSMNIERNTPEAHKLRQKWALQNKVNIPSAITGAKLLRQAQQLTVVPKPKQMTRILERVA